MTRISPELHRQVHVAAAVSGKSLNAWVAEQLQSAAQHFGEIKGPEMEVAKTKTAKKTASRKKNSPQHA